MVDFLEVLPPAEGGIAREGLGPETDWIALVREHRPLMYAICRRFALTREESDDAVQHTWLKLYESRAAVRQPDRLRGWIATTLRRECIALRAARWRESPMAEPPAAAVDSDLTDLVARRQISERLFQALDLLPRHERCVVEALLDPEEPSYAEISQRLHTPIGSIGPRRGRALQHLRFLLRDLTDGEGDEWPDSSVSTAGGRS
jgi:RNA polymerase sigma factor (sigma-70 family)